MSEFQFIKTITRNKTGIITINRQEVYNALNLASKFEIINAIRLFNKDNEIRAIIITGEGKAFCSGQDLNDRTVKPESGKKVDIGHTLITEWNPLIMAIRESEKIVTAAINGVCAGAGLSVALACDLKYAKSGNRFISGFTQIGLTPDAGMDHVLVRSMGYSKALEFCLTGKPLMSEEMLNYGLLNGIVDDPLATALEISETIADLAPLSVKTVKSNLQYAEDQHFKSVLEREIATQRYLGNSQDYTEGVTAFLDKRKPVFTGK
jgi:2-(1,2-epoxy-1,2-dihydrophenyl)acetyl-CoA isomerase